MHLQEGDLAALEHYRLDAKETQMVSFLMGRPYPLHYAELSVKMLSALVGWGKCDPTQLNGDGLSLIMYQVQFGEEAVVYKLLQDPRVQASLNDRVCVEGPWMDTTVLLQVCYSSSIYGSVKRTTKERVRIIKALVKAGADPTMKDATGYNALDVLYRDRPKEDVPDVLLRRVLEKGEVTIPLESYLAQRSPLSLPQTGEITKEVLEEGKHDPSTQDEEGTTALMCQARCGNELGVRLLLQAPGVVTEGSDMAAAMPSTWQGWKALNGTVNPKDDTVQARIVRALLEAGMFWTALWAGMSLDDHVVDAVLKQMLVNGKVIPFAFYQYHPSPMHRPMSSETVVLFGDQDWSRVLSEKPPKGITVLMQQCRWGNEKAVIYLLQDPGVLASVDTAVDSEEVEYQGYTAMHFACAQSPAMGLFSSERVAVVRRLLAAGADPSILDAEGMSPRDVLRVQDSSTKDCKRREAAILLRRDDVMNTVQSKKLLATTMPLFDHKAPIGMLNVMVAGGLVDPTQVNQAGLTLLMVNCDARTNLNNHKNYQLFVLRLLIDSKMHASINAITPSNNLQVNGGFTAMHYLVSSREQFGRRLKKILAAMCDAGADPRIKNAAGETPLDLLRRYGNTFDIREEVAVLEDRVKELEGVDVLVKARRLVMLQNTLQEVENQMVMAAAGRGEREPLTVVAKAPLILLRGPLKRRLEQNKPLPHVTLVEGGGGEEGEEKENLRRNVAFLVGLDGSGGKELPGGVFIRVMEYILPPPAQVTMVEEEGGQIVI